MQLLKCQTTAPVSQTFIILDYGALSPSQNGSGFRSPGSVPDPSVPVRHQTFSLASRLQNALRQNADDKVLIPETILPFRQRIPQARPISSVLYSAESSLSIPFNSFEGIAPVLRWTC